VPHNILIIDGHPDGDRARYLHALAGSYAGGAKSAGHSVRLLEISRLELKSLCSNAEFISGTPSAMIQRCQADILWADHVVLLFPLWLGDMPGLLKIFLEQVARPDFAFAEPKGKGLPKKLLKGRSARIVVTMGMPAFFYRWYYRGHSVKNLKRNILEFCGFSPVRTTLVGMVEGMSDAQRRSWLVKLEALGRKAQ
jgi:putative NADPH-quinone reductase